MKNILKGIKGHIKLLTQSKSERRHALVGPAHLWKMKRNFQFKFLIENGLTPQHFLLDIGCGTLRGGIPLIDYLQEGRYFGIESRESVLSEGRRELREAGLESKSPTLLFAPDISQVNIQHEFDFIWAFSVLIHMSDEILYDALGFVSAHLLDTGFFYANVNIGGREGGNWQGFPIVWRSLDFYEEACSRNGLIVSDLGPLKKFGHITSIKSHDEQQMLQIRKV